MHVRVDDMWANFVSGEEEEHIDVDLASTYVKSTFEWVKVVSCLVLRVASYVSHRLFSFGFVLFVIYGFRGVLNHILNV